MVLSFQEKLLSDTQSLAIDEEDDRHDKMLQSLLTLIKLEVVCREQVPHFERKKFTSPVYEKRAYKSRERLPSATFLCAEATKPKAVRGRSLEPCLFYGEEHDIRNRKTEDDPLELEERQPKSHRCFRCGEQYHSAKACRTARSMKCEKCSWRHLSVLCKEDRNKAPREAVSMEGTVKESGA